MPDPEYDAIIAGARCAGAATATFLARGGWRVLLLDADPLPSDYFMSTHTLHAVGMDVLDELGVGDGVRQGSPASRVVRFDVDGAHVDLAFPSRPEHCPRRELLDGLLQDAARQAGVEVRARTKVIGLLRAGEAVTGVRVSHDGGEQEITGGIVVGADGRHSTVAELAGAEEYLGYDGPRGAYWAYWDAAPVWGDPGATRSTSTSARQASTSGRSFRRPTISCCSSPGRRSAS